MVQIHNQDCMEAMKSMKTGQYDLAIVDPPYGIKAASKGFVNPIKRGKAKTKTTKYKHSEWDKSPPKQKYFDELRRVSKQQIIFGANHFISKIPIDTSCWIVWNKDNGSNGYADCELAWTSFKTSVRMFTFRWHGMLQQNMKHKEQRIHCTQKPVALYLWLLQKYAKPGWKILDTHLGSGSIAIACHDLNFDFDGYEIDEEYYENALKRFRHHKLQMKLF